MNVATIILRVSHFLQTSIYILTLCANLYQINHRRIKEGHLYHRNFFYIMPHSDAHFILQGVLKMMIPTRLILMILIKSHGDVF